MHGIDSAGRLALIYAGSVQARMIYHANTVLGLKSAAELTNRAIYAMMHTNSKTAMMENGISGHTPDREGHRG